MKKLNLNNAIATTAMLTKTNTMKNKMNFFAKVVMLVAMMSIGNKCYSQDLSWFQGDDGTWYIYNGSLKSSAKDEKVSSGVSSIYLPSSADASCEFDYNFTEHSYWALGTRYRPIRYFVKIGNNEFNEFCFNQNRTTKNIQQKTSTITTRTQTTVEFGWTDETDEIIWMTQGRHEKNKECTLKIFVPVHCDKINFNNVFTGVGNGGTLTCNSVGIVDAQSDKPSASSTEMKLTDLFNSFLTDNATNGGKIKFKVTSVVTKGANGQPITDPGKGNMPLFYFGIKGTTPSPTQQQTEYHICGPNEVCQQVNGTIYHDKDIVVYFNPSAIGISEATIKVYKDNETQQSLGTFKITGECKLSEQIITWNVSDEDKVISTTSFFSLIDNGATTNGDGKISYESGNTNVLNIGYDDDGNPVSLLPVQGSTGTVDITVNASATNTYSAAQPRTIQFRVTDDRPQIIYWNNDFSNVQLTKNQGGQIQSQTINLLLEAKDKLGNTGYATPTITSITTVPQGIASLSNNNTTLTITGKGTITLNAQVAGGSMSGITYLPATSSITFNVRIQGDVCGRDMPITPTPQNNTTTSPISYYWTGYPEELTCTLNNGTSGERNVKFAKPNAQTLWTETITGNSGNQRKNYTFTENVKGVTITGLYSHWLNGDLTLSGLKVTQKTDFVPTTPALTDFNNNSYTFNFNNNTVGNENKSDVREFDAEFYNLPEIIMETSGTDDARSSFRWEETTTGTVDCNQCGTKSYKFYFKPAAEGEQTLTITYKYQAYDDNGNSTQKSYTIILKGTGEKVKQNLSWNDLSRLNNLNTLSTKTDDISLTGLATATSGLTPKYAIHEIFPAEGVSTTDEQPVVEISGNDGEQSLKIHKAGTFIIKATQSGNKTYGKADTIYTTAFTISRVASSFSIALDEQNPKVFGTYGITETRSSATSDDDDISDGAITISTNDGHASTSKSGDKYSVTFKDRVTEAGTPVTINATMAQTDVYKASTCSLVVTPAKVSPSISWTGPGLANPVANSTVSFTLGEMQKGTNDPDISSWDESIKIVYSTSDNEFAEVINNSQINFKKHGNVTIKANIPAGINNNAATEVSHPLTIACAPQSISWTPAATEYKVGNTITLDASSPANNITYSTSNADIVSTDGVCHKAGYVQITASSADNGVFCEAASASKSFHVDFADNFFLTCKDATVDNTSDTGFDMTDYFVPSNTSYTVSSSSTEFVVTKQNNSNYITIQFSPTSVNNGDSDTEEKEATITIIDNGQTYTFTVKATAEKKDADLVIADIENPIVFSTITPSLSSKATDETDVTYTYTNSEGTSTGPSYKFTSTEKVTIIATTNANTKFKAGRAKVEVTPAKVSPTITWSVTNLGSHSVSESPLEFTQAVMGKADNDPEISEWSGIAIEYQSSDESIAEVVNGEIVLHKAGTVTITPVITEGVNNNAAPAVTGAQLVVTCWEQTITWNPTTSLKVGETVTMDATASGNTDITYESGNTDIISNNGKCLKAGYTSFTAKTNGSEVYCSAESVQNFSVDFADNTVKNCSTAMVMSSSTTTFNLNTEMVKSGDLKLESCSNSEFSVSFSGYDMNVTFIPTTAGERTADLAFKDDNMTYHLQLTATATAPTITFNPTVIGTASVSTNTLDISAITLTSLTSDGNIRLVDNGTEHDLPYNGTITGPLTFKYYPTEVETNAEHTLTVNGTYNIIYNVTSTQHTIRFAETKVGVATAQQQFEMTNFVATGALTAYTSSSEFRINGARYSSSVPLTISNGATLNIDFSPRNTCDFNTTPAELIISDNGTLYKVNLTGKTEDLEPIDLGTVNIGQASEAFEIDDIPQTGTVTVTSSSPYVFRVFADDEESTLSTATANNGQIDVTGKGKLYVKFYPETAGEQNETITISIIDSYGETSSYSVNVSGTGAQQTLNISSTMGQLSGTQIALTNMVSAEGYTISLPDPEEFRINDDVVASIDVTGGSSLGIKLYPKTSGNKSETVTILDKSTNRSYTINLTGTVTALPNLSFNQQKVAKTDVTDNKTITLSAWPENMYELDILDGSGNSYAESFLIRGVAGVSSLVNGVNETVQFRPKKVFNTPLTLYAREKSSGILYPIAEITASSIQNDEVQLVWSDNSDPIMIGMNDCSYGFAYAVGLPELNVFYSVSNDNITTCGEATLGIKSGESTPRNHYSGLQGVNNGATATVTAYILQSDEYLAQPITRTFQVTDKLSQEIVYQYDTIVLTVGEAFSLTDVNAPYAIDKVDKDATGAQISYSVNGGYISLNGTNLSVNAAGSGGYIDIKANAGTYNAKEYLSATKRVCIIGAQEEICNYSICSFSNLSYSQSDSEPTETKNETNDFKGKPVGYMGPFNVSLSRYSALLTAFEASLSIGKNGSTDNVWTKGTSRNLSNYNSPSGGESIIIFAETISSIKVTGKTEGGSILGQKYGSTLTFSGASLYQKKYFNKTFTETALDAGEAELYSSTTTDYIEVANYSALNGIIRYRIVGPDAKSFKVAETKTGDGKPFTGIECGDLSTAKVKIEFTPQRIGDHDYNATLELYASTNIILGNLTGPIQYTKIEIPLTGTGTPRTQQISWAQGDRLANLKYDDYIDPDANNEIELTAYSSIKGQEVSYAFCDDQGNTLETDPTFVSLSGKTLTINGAGDTYIKATQAGKTDGGTVVILPADPVILHVIVAKADPKLKWNSEYTDDWMYVFGTKTIAAHSEPIEGNPSISGSTGAITYSTTTTDLADCTAEGSLKVKKYGEVTIKAVIAEDDNYLGGEDYALTNKFNPKKVTPVINWAEESLGNYKQGDVVTLENGLEATINKSTDGEPDVTLWSDDIAVAYSSQNTQIATVSGNVVSLPLNGKKGVVTIQADVPVGANGNNIAATPKTRTMKVDFAASDIRDCGTAAVLQSCSTQPVNLSDEIITASNSSFSYIGSSNKEFTGSISNGVLTVTFTPTSVKEPATQNAVITIKDNSNDEEYHINVKGTATLHQGSINYITTAGHWTFQANAGTKTLTIASNGDIWGDQDEMNSAITLSSDKEDNVTVSGNTITIVGGDADTDDDVTVTLTASFPGNDRIAPCSTDITLTIQKLASGLALNKAELNNNAYVYSTIAMLADELVSDGDLNIEVTPASTHEVSEDNKITLKSCFATTITATTAGTTIYKSGSDNVTFTPKKVTPVVTWNGNDFTTDLSNSEFTLTDEASVTAADGQPDVSVWDEEAKTIVYSSMTPNVATLKSGETNTFELHKVGYATIQAKIEAGDNNEASNVVERHLKVDFNPTDSLDFDIVSVYKTKTIPFDLSSIAADGRGSIYATNNTNTTDFEYGQPQNNELPLTFKPQSHDADKQVKTATITIQDGGNKQDYHLVLKGKTTLAEPKLKYNDQNHNRWEFVVQLPNETIDMFYGSNMYDVDWDGAFPNPSSATTELNRLELSLKNTSCSTYVDIINNSQFKVKQANVGDNNPVKVTLVVTYPGLENKIASTSIEIPIVIKKNQYSLNWNKPDGFEIEIYQGSKPLAAPTKYITLPNQKTPIGGDSIIKYSFSEEGIGTYDGSTFTLIGPPYKSGKLTASIASDKYAIGTSAELNIKVKKTEQTVTWAGDEIKNGFTTQKSTTEGIQLTAEAFRGSTKTNANIRYEVFENSNCSGEGDLIRLDVNKEEKPWITTLYYTGNGSGTVSIQAIAEETDEYNESKADDPSASPIVTFDIIREGCNVNSWTVADMHYGDKVTLAPAVNKFTKGSDYEYTLPTVTGTLVTAGNVLDVKGVGNSLTISAKKLEDCWVTESANKPSNTFNIAKSEQKIEWSQPDISAAAIGDVEHQLEVPVAKDKLHTIGEGTWLSTLETGLDVTYNIDQTAATKCSTDAIVVIEDGELKITGRGSGTVTITAQQTSGSEYYNPTNATDEKSIIVTISKITPTITISGAPTGNVGFGTAPMTITAQAVLNGNVVKDYQNIELYTLANNKIKLTTSDPTTVSVTENNTLNFLKSGSATITATIEADCIVKNKVETTFTVTVDRATQVLKWESWPAGETKSITTCDKTFEIALDATTTDVSGNPTGENNVSYEIVSTNGNCNTALVKIEDNKLTYLDAGSGSVEIKAVVAQSDKYSAIADGESMHRTFVINRCSTDVIVWDGTELNNVHYNDVIVPNADFSELSKKASNKGSISYSVTRGPLNNEFKATGVGAAEITATTGENCYSTGATMTKSFTIHPTTQKIVWAGDELAGLTTGQYANGGKVIELTAKSYDTGTGHNHEETGLDIHYEISDISGESGCENFVMLDPNDNHKLIVTGTGAGTFKITASQKGKDGDGASGKDLYYEAATDVTIDVTISKITPTISFEPQNPMNYGDKVAVTASSALEGIYSSNADENNGITITSASNDEISIYEGFMKALGVTSETGVTLTASQADNCVVSEVNPVSENVIVTLGQQQMVWNGKSTASIDVAGTQTFTFNPYAIDKLHKDENRTWLTLTNGEFKTENTVEYVIGNVTPCESSTEFDLVSVDENGVIRATGKGTGTVRIWAKADGDTRYAEITADEDKVYIDVTVNGVEPAIQSFDISSLNSIHYGDRVKLSSPKTNYFVNQGDNKTTFSYANNAAYGISAIGTDTMFDAKAVGTGYTIVATQEAIACFNQASDAFTSSTFNIAKSEQEIEWEQTDMTLDVVGSEDVQLTAYAIDSRHKDQAATCLTLTDGKYITAKTAGDDNVTPSETGMKVTYIVEEQDGVCKVVDGKPIVTVDETGLLHVTGNGTGQVKITPTVSEGAHYNAATGTESIIVTVNKVNPVITFTRNEINGGNEIYYSQKGLPLNASSTYGSGAYTYSAETAENGGAILINNENSTFNATHAGKVNITVVKATDCIAENETKIFNDVEIKKADQVITWNPLETSLLATDNTYDKGILLDAVAHNALDDTEVSTASANIKYEIITNEDGLADVAEIVEVDGKSYLVAKGTGAGSVKVVATASVSGNFNEKTETKTFTVNKAVADFFTIADITMTYNDKAISLDNDISGGKLTLGTDYQVSYSVGDNGTDYFNVDDANKTINPLKANVEENGDLVEMTLDASISGMTNYNDKQITGKVYVKRANQTIVWSDIQTSYNTWNVGGEKTINLDDYTQSKDASHDNNDITPDLNKTYELVISDKGCDIEDASVAYIENNVLHITGAASATLTIYAKQDGTDDKGENYTKVEEANNCTTVITINKITPTISFDRSNVNDGEEVYYSDPITYTVSSTGTDYSVSDVSAFTFNVTPVDQGAISENVASHAGNVKIKASQAEDCMINGAESGEVDVEIKKAPQHVNWDVADLGTLSATSTEGVKLTAVAMNSRRSTPSEMTITYTVCDAQGNDITSGALITIDNDNKVYSANNGSGEAWVKAVANGNDNYEASETLVIKKITITNATPTIAWTDPCSEQMTMNYREEKQLTFSCNYTGYTASYSLTETSDDTYVDMTELVKGNVKIIGVKPDNGTIGIKVTISDPKGNYSDGELTTAISTLKNNTEIDWTGQSFGTYTTADAGTEIELKAYVKDLFKNDNSRETVSYGFKGTDVVEGCGKIVELTEEGKLKITGNAAGTVTLYANYAGDDNYNASDETSMTITVGKQTPSFAWATEDDISATYGETGKTAVATHDGTGTVTYGSSEQTVATIDENGNITIVGAGTTTLSATLAADCKYEAVTTAIEKTLTVNQATGTIRWVTGKEPHNDTYSITLTEEVVATSNNTDDGSIEYSSSNNDVADFENGVLKIYKAGTTTITATRAATKNFTAASCSTTITISKASCTITVTAPQNITFGQTEALQYSTTNTDQNLQVTFTSGNTSIVSISGDQATGAGVGTTYVYAEIAESDNYLSAKSDDFNITVTQASKTFTIDDMSLKYGDQNEPITITDGGITGYTVSYSIDDADKSYIVFNPDGTINAIKAHCDAQGNLVNIPVTASFTHANYTIADATFNVTVAKKRQTITWNETFTGPYNIFSEIKFNATTDADAEASETNKVYYTWTQNSTCENTPVFGHGLADNIINYDATDGALINAAGTVTITAHYSGNENYLPADCSDTKTFTIGVGTPTIQWTTDFKESNYNKDGTIVLSATSNYNNNESPILYEIVSMTPANCATLDKNTNTLTCVAPGQVTVKAYQNAFSCKINYSEITQTIQIGQGPHVITWNKSKAYSVNNLAGTIDLSNYCKCSTCSTCLITYSIDGTTGVSLDTDGHTLNIDESISEQLNVVVTANVAENDTYEASSNDTTFIITVESLTITVNGGSDTDNPLDLSAAEPYVTSVTDNVDLAQKLVGNGILSSNYKNVTYTFASDDTNIATFNTDYKTIIAYKRSDALKLTVTATVDENRKCSKDFWVKIPRGTMVFNRDGNWNDMLSDGSNWHRRDLIPTKVDHNVSIAANCTVNVKTAECYDMEIAGNGTLTISTAGILNVADTLLNNDAGKLRIEADANGQGTLIFHNKKTMPMATVEMWCKGSETGTGADGKNINPNWQYRGIAVSLATLTENAPDLIYQWTEAAHASDAGTGITEQWTKVTDNQMLAWKGYAVAKYTDANGNDYKTSAAGALTNADQEITLAFSSDQQSGNGVQTGFNLITNSFTAPIRIKDIVFGDETEGVDDVMKGIVLFNTGSYAEWNASDREIREGKADPGQYLFLPKYTAEQIATTELIPSGESFFVVAYQTDKTVQIPYSAVDSLKRSGPLKMPERREVYGKLIIEVDGGEGADRLYLLENENRIRGFENGYDGPKYAGTKGNPMLYATTDDGRMCVSADSSLLGQYIGFAAGKHDVTYTMTFDASALSGYSELYLYDTREKRYTNILDGGTYTFKGLVSGEDRRFKIVGSRENGESVTGDDQTIIVTGNRFHVTGYDNADERIYLVDMTGKILWETSTAFGPWFDIPTDIPAGVYVIKTGNHTAKMAVK